MAKTVNARTLPVQSIGYKYGKLIIPPYEVDVEFTPLEEAALDSGITADMIPDVASANNPLADKQYVDDNIASASATFKGNYNLVTDLSLTVSASHSDVETALANIISAVDKNDYCYVDVPTSDLTPTQIEKTERYKFNGTSWDYEYSPTPAFSAAQWAALNSGIYADLVNKLDTLPNVNDYTSWDSVGTTQGGAGAMVVIDETGYKKIVAVTNSYTVSNMPIGNELYVPASAVLDGNTLITVYNDPALTADSGIKVKISTARKSTIEEALSMIYYLSRNEAVEYADNTFVVSLSVKTIISLTQSDYDNLQTKDPNTLYVIIEP